MVWMFFDLVLCFVEWFMALFANNLNWGIGGNIVALDGTTIGRIFSSFLFIPDGYLNEMFGSMESFIAV